MAEIPVAALKAISRELDSLQIKHVFTGGSIVAFLLDKPNLIPLRTTDDVDVIVELITHKAYSKFEEQLRSLGFHHDVSEGAPRCRWIYRNLKVDTMPVEGSFLGLNTIWFDQALATATQRVIDDQTIRVISPSVFIATKLAAFTDRGNKDFYGSHDLEDILTVIDGREAITEDIKNASAELKNFIVGRIQSLSINPRFKEALPGHLPPDPGSQARLPILRQRIDHIASLGNGD